MDKKGKADYLLLEAWINFSQGNTAIAAGQAAKAYSLDPLNGDAYASQIVFSVLESRPPKPKTRIKTKITDEQNSAQDGMTQSAITVFFPEGAEKLIGSKLVGEGEVYSQRFTSILFWRLPQEGDFKDIERQLPRTFDEEEKSKLQEELDQARKLIEDAAKEELACVADFAAHNKQKDIISFFAINTNSYDFFDTANSFAASHGFKNLNLNMGPIDPDELNKIVVSDLKAVSLVREPVFVIISPEGEIKYAGSARGQLPRMAIEAVVPGALEMKTPKSSSQVPDQTIFPADANPFGQQGVKNSKPAVTDSNSIETPAGSGSDSSAAPADKSQGEVKPSVELTEEQRAQAQQLIQKARMYRGSHTKLGSSRKLVETCREIIKTYPGTEFEQGAKEILKSIPEHQRRKFGVKEEELK